MILLSRSLAFLHFLGNEQGLEIKPRLYGGEGGKLGPDSFGRRLGLTLCCLIYLLITKMPPLSPDSKNKTLLGHKQHQICSQLLSLSFSPPPLHPSCLKYKGLIFNL